MSAEDWLRRASRSLQDEAHEITADETTRTRERVMASLTVVERRRNRVVLLFIPIAAVLAASFAVAHEGVTLRHAWGWLADHASGTKEPARVETLRPKVSAAPPRTPQETAVAPATAAAPGMPTPPSTSPSIAKGAASPPAPRPTISSASPGPASTSPPSTTFGAPVSPDETDATGLALYRSAHRLHFVDHDYAASLSAWEAYLRSVPGGPLVVEARYNRALALVHLGRDAEAKIALEPFALGRVEGGYRQAEARALLDALDARDP
jgi:hypothetical protein